MIRRFLSRHPFAAGTLTLAASGMITRLLGLVCRIFLSRTLGEKDMGLLHLALPVMAICLSVSSSGLQPALSRLTAGYRQRSPGQERYMLRCALVICTVISFLAAAAVFSGADLIASVLLHEINCRPLLRMLALSLPFSCIHSCLCGFDYGCQQAYRPALSLILEQTIRLGTIFSVWAVKTALGGELTLTDTAFCALCGELSASLFYCLSKRRFYPAKVRRELPYRSMTGELLRTALPLSCSRLCTALLTGTENLLIPVCLNAGGLSMSDALSIYGVLTGMAMPFILFPAGLMRSMTSLLMPRIAFGLSADNISDLYAFTAVPALSCLFQAAAFARLSFLLPDRILELFFSKAEKQEKCFACFHLCAPSFILR